MVEPLSVVDAREPLAVIDDGKTGRRTKPITTGKKSQTKLWMEPYRGTCR
jgi:hypothetical protein